MRIVKNENVIQSVDDWFRYAKPKGGTDQWFDGRSAKELAAAWFADGSLTIPAELSGVLASHPDIQGAQLEIGEPGAKLRFDRGRDEVRNADLAIEATPSYYVTQSTALMW